MSFMLGNKRGPRRSQMIAQQRKKIVAEQERVKKIEEMKSAFLKEELPVIEETVDEVQNILISEQQISETVTPLNDSVEEDKEELVEATKDVNVKEIVEDIENKEEAPSTESTDVSNNDTVETTDLSGNEKKKSKKSKKNKKN